MLIHEARVEAPVTDRLRYSAADLEKYNQCKFFPCKKRLNKIRRIVKFSVILFSILILKLL